MNKLDSFINSRRQDRSTGRNRLLPYKNEIQYLLENGMSYKDISDYLKAERVEVANSTIGAFCRKHFTNSQDTKTTKPNLIEVQKAEITEDKTTELKNDKEEIPQHRRLAEWAKIPGVDSLDDLI